MRAGQGQTLIDVAAQVCGSAELAWDIAVRSGFGLTDIPGNTELDVPTDGGDRDTAAEMAASDAKPATDGTPRRDRIVPIGQFGIGRDIIR
ncbi:MAG: hypothetical protein IKX32_07720 [Bacteroidales bacterium]|nr:hypothetical protein [Bacteroidales bacterium]